VTLLRNMLISAVLLGLFAVAGSGLLAFTYDQTKDRIAANHRERLLQSLHVLVPRTLHDNDISHDIIQVQDRELLGSDHAVKVYRARNKGEPVAVIINSVAPDGYNGRIDLLVAIHYDGTLSGVRVVAHRETPGLGDAIEIRRSDWILGFKGRSLSAPQKRGWAVKRDGGEFDQFTGATITPRAVVKAVHNTLLYFQAHRDALFAPMQPSAATETPS